MTIKSLTTFSFGAESLYQSSLPLSETNSGQRNSYFDQKSINLGALGGEVTQGNFTYSADSIQSDSTPMFTSLFPSSQQETLNSNTSTNQQITGPSIGPYIWGNNLS